MELGNAQGNLPLCLPAQSTKVGLWSITLLRGLAALWVCLSHGDGLWWRAVPDLFFGNARDFFSTQPVLRIVSGLLFGMGFLGVPLFFVISGFCIHLPQAGKSDPLDFRVFAIRRFFRIYPLYIAVVIVCFALLTLRFGWGGIPNLNLTNLLGHLVFWHYADGSAANAGMGISPPMWTLAIEVQFYILYAITLPVLRRVGLGRCAAIGLGIDIAYRMGWYSTGLFYYDDVPRFVFPARLGAIRFGEWLLGAWVAELYVTGRLRQWCGALKPSALVGGGLLCIASGVALCAAFGLRAHTTDVPAALGFMLVLVGAIAWESSQGNIAVGQGFWARLASAVGDRSYSLYLVHLTVMAGVMDLWVRFRHIADKNAPRGSWEYFLVVLAGVALTFVAVEMTYRLIEMPSHRLARRLARKLAMDGASQDARQSLSMAGQTLSK
ncbi:MAG: acyltransferase family protein [Bacillota bacterium]